MSNFDEILEANRRFAERFDQGDLARAPRRRLVILTCMDARLDPVAALGLAPGDAHVLRNAGGRASDDAIRSIAVSSAALGVREVVVIHHTDCGMEGVRNERLREVVAERTGSDPADVDFLPFPSIETSIQDDVDRIRLSPLVARDVVVHGCVYDVRSGELRRVV